MMDYILIYTLAGLNVFQMIYWSWQTHVLVNKLMSRDYVNYTSAQSPEIKPTLSYEPQAEEDVQVPFIP